VAKWGGASSTSFKENLAYAKVGLAIYATPELVAKVDASGLGNDPTILEILRELGRQRAHTFGDNTVSNVSIRSSFDEASRPLPSGGSAAQRENCIFEETPPGTSGYDRTA
jgi:hypothetical protein